MHPILRNILAALAGIVGGSIINMALVETGHLLFPIEGIDTSDTEALAQVMSGLSWEYFLFPFLAHAIGTLAGAIIVARISKHPFAPYAIGGWFLLGGIAVSFMIPAPTWFVVTDLVLAYLPMAFLGGRIAQRMSSKA